MGDKVRRKSAQLNRIIIFAKETNKLCVIMLMIGSLFQLSKWGKFK